MTHTILWQGHLTASSQGQLQAEERTLSESTDESMTMDELATLRAELAATKAELAASSAATQDITLSVAALTAERDELASQLAEAARDTQVFSTRYDGFFEACLPECLSCTVMMLEQACKAELMHFGYLYILGLAICQPLPPILSLASVPFCNGLMRRTH